MSDVIGANVDFWKSYAASKADERPVAGRRVSVSGGQHKGRSGVVIKHARSSYYPWRYVQGGLLHAMEIDGRRGFVCRVRFDEGGEGWVKGEHAEVTR